MKIKLTSSQLKTSTKRPTNPPKAFTDSVLPVPAGPNGFPTSPRCSDWKSGKCVLYQSYITTVFCIIFLCNTRHARDLICKLYIEFAYKILLKLAVHNSKNCQAWDSSPYNRKETGKTSLPVTSLWHLIHCTYLSQNKKTLVRSFGAHELAGAHTEVFIGVRNLR